MVSEKRCNSVMNKARRHWYEMPWVVLLSLFFGTCIYAYGPILRRAALDSYYSIFPVVQYKSEVIGKMVDDSVMIHVFGKKLRDCMALVNSIETYAIRDGIYYDVDEMKVKGFVSSRPVGIVDLGVWKVWPVQGADHIKSFILHDCDGYIVRSVVIDIRLP